jgi:cyclophilin family peptidyl-prolyl cis-trans isomerase
MPESSRVPGVWSAAMRTPLTYLLVVALGACGGGGDSKPDAGGCDGCDAAPQPDGGGELYIPTGYTLTPFLSDTPEHTFTAPEDATEDGKDYAAVLDTSAGLMVLDLHETVTPITVNSFVFLARHHYFDGIAFHRVIDGFMAQTGDPNTLNANMGTWGSGGPGYGYGLEIDASLTYEGAGVVGMARTSDPNSNGSQFFITFADAHNLDGDYTIFAQVIEGLDVLPDIVRGEPPTQPTRMQRVYIVEKQI